MTDPENPGTAPDFEHIEVLEGLEPVRVRPKMYVGSTDAAGIEHMVFGLVEDALTEHAAGRARRLRVDLGDDWVEVEHDGAGLGGSDQRGRCPLELAFTVLMAGAAHGDERHVHLSSWVGAMLPVANALSTRLDVESRHGGRRWQMAFVRGVTVVPLRDAGPTKETGVTVRFRPDPRVFGEARLDRARLERRLRDLQWTTPLLAIELCRKPLPWRAGLGGLVEEMLGAARPLGDVIVSGGRAVSDVDVRFAVAWRRGDAERIRAFVGVHPTDEGTHVEGMHAAWSDVAQKLGGDLPPARGASLLCRGLVAVLHVELADASWVDPTRTRLTTPRVAESVRKAVADELGGIRWRAPRLAEALRKRLGVHLR